MRIILTSICLAWLGVKMQAPNWYFGLVVVSLLARAIDAYRYAKRNRVSRHKEMRLWKK